MYRRIVFTMVGALAGYLVGAVVGMMAFALLNGYRSVAIIEEPNRNRWTFVAAATAAVVGGLIARRAPTWMPPDERPGDRPDDEPGHEGDDVTDDVSSYGVLAPDGTSGSGSGPAAGVPRTWACLRLEESQP